MRRTLAVMGVVLFALQFAYADASYEHTSRISGGQFIDFLKDNPIISKQMKALTEPNSEITMVHGNQKATVSKFTTDIYDLDKQQVFHIDNEKKTFSVVTFADYRKMLQELPARMAQMQQQMKDLQAQQGKAQMPPSNLQTNFTTSVSDPGVTKVINGKNAKQQILTLKMTVTDPSNAGTNVAYTMTTEIWTTPELPEEMKAVQDFDRRFYGKLMEGQDLSGMAEKLKEMGNSQGGAMAMMFGGKPGAAEAFAQMQKEMAKITGTKILEIMRMGGSGTGIAPQQGSSAAGSGQPQQQGSQQQGGSTAGQIATDTASGTAQGEVGSHLGSSIPGSALGGALMNAWNRKKAKPAAPAPAPAAAPAAATGAQTDVTLMEMTTETRDFSQESIPPSVFDIPAGYKQVPSPMEQMLQHK